MRRLWLIVALAFVGASFAEDIGDWAFYERTRSTDGSSSNQLMSVSQSVYGTPYGALFIECFTGMPTGVHMFILDDRMDQLGYEGFDVHFWVDGNRLLAKGTAFPLPPGQSGVLIFPDVNVALFSALDDARTLLAQVMVSDSWAPQYLWPVRGFPEGLTALGCYEEP